MEKQNEKDLYRRAVEGTKERVEKELPILKQNLATLKENANNFYALPLTVHNIAVILNSEAYRFFKPILNLWESNNAKRRAWFSIGQASLLESTTKKVCEILSTLIRQEKNAYSRQLDAAKQERKHMLSKKSDEPVPTLEEMEKYFQHIEYDPSPMLERFMYLVTKNEITLNEDHNKYLREIYNTCANILEEYIPKREEAIKKCDYILGEMKKAAKKTKKEKAKSGN